MADKSDYLLLPRMVCKIAYIFKTRDSAAEVNSEVCIWGNKTGFKYIVGQDFKFVHLKAQARLLEVIS